MDADKASQRKLVRDLMKVGVPTCSPHTPVPEVARLLLDGNLEGIVVLDSEGHGIGVVTRDDLVRAYAREDAKALTAEDVMSEGVPQVPPDIPLVAAAQLMRDQGWRVVYLMHNAGGIVYPAAMLSYTHLLRHLAAQSDEDLSDLGIAATRQAPLDAFRQRQRANRQGIPSSDGDH
jgi:CBS domain-containing protein